MYRSKVSPSDSTHSSRSRDVDEGIGESEPDVPRDSPGLNGVDNTDASVNASSSSSTPLLVGYVSTSDDVLGKSLLDMGKESSASTLSSVQTATTTSSSSCSSEKNSPEEEHDPRAAHIAARISEFGDQAAAQDGGGGAAAAGEPSSVMDTADAASVTAESKTGAYWFSYKQNKSPAKAQNSQNVKSHFQRPHISVCLQTSTTRISRN